MTESEVIDFVDKVKGKAIVWTNWPLDINLKNFTIVPTGDYEMTSCSDFEFKCVVYKNGIYDGEYDYFGNNGFGSFGGEGHRWEIVGEPVDLENKSLECECGGEKFGGGSHSNWCPKSNVG